MSEDTTGEVLFIPIKDIVIIDRARTSFDFKSLGELAESIEDPDIGLINAINVAHTDNRYILDAGERRIKAVTMLYELDKTFQYHGIPVPEGCIPAVKLTDPTDLARLKRELAENNERMAFLWEEEVALKKKIAQIEQAKLDAEKGKTTKPNTISMSSVTPEAMAEAVKKTKKEVTRGSTARMREDLKLAEAMENKEIAEQLSSAKSKSEANKMLKKMQREKQSQLLAEHVGNNFQAEKHKIYQGDCREKMKDLPRNYFTLCITDPPYGINAQNFGDSGGRMTNFSHNYDDSPETWRKLMPEFLAELTEIMKPHSHTYLACDFSRFPEIIKMLEKISFPTKKNGIPQPRKDKKMWRFQRTPLIQTKSNGRVPIPAHSYRRSYECWVYAWLGKKETNAIVNDVIATTSPGRNVHGAVKGENVIRTFLRVSGEPGQHVFDGFAGSGSVLPLVHEASMYYTGIESASDAYGELIKTLKKLKTKGKV